MFKTTKRGNLGNPGKSRHVACSKASVPRPKCGNRVGERASPFASPRFPVFEFDLLGFPSGCPDHFASNPSKLNHTTIIFEETDGFSVPSRLLVCKARRPFADHLQSVCPAQVQAIQNHSKLLGLAHTTQQQLLSPSLLYRMAAKATSVAWICWTCLN